ncbi:class I SAM-dependent methyltransferase [Candidatus Aeolococcus gillhamiae]|uniref:class I SAM-dependent methyltransferase n=1 Tax=Candidatus Aeolococcus gillhamiae TaxID=3127015 RepID=UPI003312FC67
MLILAKAFPNGEITGYDLDPALTEGTIARAANEGLANVQAMAVSADELPEQGGYDLITCLDSFHHFGDPAAVARSAHRGLGDGGVFLVAESATSGDLAQDAQKPVLPHYLRRWSPLLPAGESCGWRERYIRWRRAVLGPRGANGGRICQRDDARLPDWLSHFRRDEVVSCRSDSQQGRSMPARYGTSR